MTEALAPQAPQKLSPMEAVRQDLDRMSPQFKMALPSHISVDKFQRVVMTALQLNPALLKCTTQSLYAACMQSAQMGLIPDGREGVIVSYYSNKLSSEIAQFQPMVKGKMKLSRNSGEVATWSIQAVYEKDEFDYAFGDEEFITHKPAKGDRGGIIGAYSIVTLRTGEKSREYMGKEEIDKIKARSKSKEGGPWTTDYAEMAKKTVVGRHCKRLPSSTDFLNKMGIEEEFEETAATAEAQVKPDPTVPAGPVPQTSSRLSNVVSTQTPEKVPAEELPL